ncbi:MAG TPA: flagellar hook-basal body complex protein FliE [Edaphobacter sp.]|nr:flagellar hook-basal body complex protein FliE [Edaphobacter sp.]
MEIQSAMQAVDASHLSPLNQSASSDAKTPFAGLFQDAIGSLQSLEEKASAAVQGLLDGSGVDIHSAMIATSNADAAFELSLAVRNKGMAAFQQMMNMQF